MAATAARERPPLPSGPVDRRLLSLEQRGALRGVHSRLHAPADGKLYVAGVTLPELSRKNPSMGAGSLFPKAVTVTIGEVDPVHLGRPLHIVQHYRWERRDGALLPQLREVLWGVWRCRMALIGGGEAGRRLLSLRPGTKGTGGLVGKAAPAAALCRGLLRAADDAAVQMYADDGSAVSRDFWSQAIRGRRRAGDDGAPEFFITPSTGEDGFVTSLALVVQAAAVLRGALASGNIFTGPTGPTGPVAAEVGEPALLPAA